MDFQFQEWERLSADVVDGEARTRFVVDGVQWWFRRCGGIWFAREAASVGCEGNFVVCSIPQGCSQSLGGYRIDATHNKLRRILQDKHKSCVLGRVWRLSELLVGWTQTNGCGLFATSEDFAHNARNLAPGFDMAIHSALPSSEVFALLQAQWDDESSDLRFAASFAALPEVERRLHGVQTRLGTPQEFAHLIKIALQVFCARWPQNIEFMSLSFGATGAGFRFSLQGDRIFGIRERAILGHIVRAFEPRQLADSPDLPPCVRTLTEGGWSRSFSIEVARPSMHERLEAMLELRAWLETHWPDGVRHLEKVI